MSLPPRTTELTQRIDRRHLLQRIGATAGFVAVAAVATPSLSVLVSSPTRVAQLQAAPVSSMSSAPIQSIALSSTSYQTMPAAASRSVPVLSTAPVASA